MMTERVAWRACSLAGLIAVRVREQGAAARTGARLQGRDAQVSSPHTRPWGAVDTYRLSSISNHRVQITVTGRTRETVIVLVITHELSEAS